MYPDYVKLVDFLPSLPSFTTNFTAFSKRPKQASIMAALGVTLEIDPSRFRLQKCFSTWIIGRGEEVKEKMPVKASLRLYKARGVVRNRKAWTACFSPPLVHVRHL